MLQLSDIQAVIFDFDDTLIHNYVRDPHKRVHERFRLQALQAVGKRYDLPTLQAITPQQNLDAFLQASTHTMEAAVWRVLELAGLVTGSIDLNHHLLQEITAHKNALYEVWLKNEAEEIKGASPFIRALAEYGLQHRLSIASTAKLSDIELFLETRSLTPLFMPHLIIAREHVTHPKPHPEVFHRAVQAFQLPESASRSLLVIEDDPRGIQAAKAAGLPVFALTTSFDREVLEALPEPPDLIADDFYEFAEILGLSVGQPTQLAATR